MNILGRKVAWQENMDLDYEVGLDVFPEDNVLGVLDSCSELLEVDGKDFGRIQVC